MQDAEIQPAFPVQISVDIVTDLKVQHNEYGMRYRAVRDLEPEPCRSLVQEETRGERRGIKPPVELPILSFYRSGEMTGGLVDINEVSF